MNKYRLDTGLCQIREEPLFDNDKDAWEYLRKLLPNKFATLYKQQEVEVSINNKRICLDKFNKKYTLQKIDKNKLYTRTVWVPVLFGITNHQYKVAKKNG